MEGKGQRGYDIGRFLPTLVKGSTNKGEGEMGAVKKKTNTNRLV